MKTTSAIVLVVVILAAILARASMYAVREGQQAVITQFGKPVREVTDAGLHFKTPFLQRVDYLEKRLLPWDGEPENMQTGDKKRIFIDVWARWRIVEPMKYFQAVGPEQRGYKILDDLVDSAVRDVVAKHPLIEVVRSTDRPLWYEDQELARSAEANRMGIGTGREQMEKDILARAGQGLRDRYGMELTDVHIKRANYIESVRVTVHERMKSERMRIARKFESEAQEEKNRIVGLTQKELDQIDGEMQQRSAEIRGQADAEVIRIAADAYSRSPEFYAFLRRLEAYKNTLKKNTRLVLSTDNEFLRQFRDPNASWQHPPE